ncbi:MAG: hypothetical protein AABO58_06190 [Acidobacteriota bacterium]
MSPPPAARIARYVYGYDAAGNITNLQDVTDPTYHRTFGYDDLNRLTTANTNSSLWKTGQYSWDAMGNILTAKLSEVITGGGEQLSAGNPKKFKPSDKPKKKKGPGVEATLPLGRTMGFTSNGTTPVLTAVTLNDLSRTVGHDAAGNETSYVVSRSYSPRNLLAEVRDASEEGPPHSLRYGYDGRGLRVERTESPSDGPGTLVHRFYLYSPELTLLAATRDDGPNVWGGNPPTTFGKNVDNEVVWFGDRPVAQIAPGSAPLYTFADHLGTPLLQTDATKAVTWRVEYEPFGNVREICYDRDGRQLDSTESRSKVSCRSVGLLRCDNYFVRPLVTLYRLAGYQQRLGATRAAPATGGDLCVRDRLLARQTGRQPSEVGCSDRLRHLHRNHSCSWVLRHTPRLDVLHRRRDWRSSRTRTCVRHCI